MPTGYIEQAMRHAHYELIGNGRHRGEFPPLPGVWAEGETLEQCRDTLRAVLEDWLLVDLRRGHRIPVIEGLPISFCGL
ncbi:MAG: type II toxin-antitoxin system HicB family antitoxin [Armatimonadetes bacterium]|nr:type II toxin-antitoxin system HicB family antitoxin [Armatimonadota bacterium]